MASILFHPASCIHCSLSFQADIVACIEAALPKDIPRSRRQIAAQLVKQGLVGSTKEVYKHKKKGVWSEEELCRLREVFIPGEDHKAAVQEVAKYFPGVCVCVCVCVCMCVRNVQVNSRNSYVL